MDTGSYSVVILEEPINFNPTSPRVMKMVKSCSSLDEARKLQASIPLKTVIVKTY